MWLMAAQVLDKPLRLESLGVGFQRMHKPCGSLLAESQWLLTFSCVWHLLQTPAVSDTVELNRQSRSQAKLTKLHECFSRSFPRATETAESRWWPATVAVWSFSSLSRSEVGASQFFSLNCGVFEGAPLRTRREACDALTPGAEPRVKSWSAGHIPLSGTAGNLSGKFGLWNWLVPWRWDLNLILSIETPKPPLEPGPLLSNGVKRGGGVLAAVCVAGETQLAARDDLALSKAAALCLAVLLCVVLTGSCRKTSQRSQIVVPEERPLHLTQSEMHTSVPESSFD